MITFCLDTASPQTAMALTRDGSLLAETAITGSGSKQNSRLLPELQRMLALSGVSLHDINLFACSCGPGSFTGVRTGVATVQGLAFATGVPCIGVSSLAMLALNLPFAAYPVCALLDARKKEVYAALFNVTDRPVPVISETVTALPDFLKKLDGRIIFIGDGAVTYQHVISEKFGDNAIFAPAVTNFPRAASGALLAEDAYAADCRTLPEQLLPSYIRLSDAEISRQQKF